MEDMRVQAVVKGFFPDYIFPQWWLGGDCSPHPVEDSKKHREGNEAEEQPLLDKQSLLRSPQKDGFPDLLSYDHAMHSGSKALPKARVWYLILADRGNAKSG